MDGLYLTRKNEIKFLFGFTQKTSRFKMVRANKRKKTNYDKLKSLFLFSQYKQNI